MYVHRVNNGKRIPQFTCSAYSKTPVGTLCSTQHRVVADVVMTLIKESLKAIIQFSQEDEAEFEKVVKEVISSQQSTDEQAQRARLATCRRRTDELETLLCKIYEDNALGRLPDKRYQLLSTQYEAETAALEAEISSLEDMLGEYESIDKLNYLASRLDEMDKHDQEKFVAIMEAGCDEVSNIDDLINLTYNLDC